MPSAISELIYWYKEQNFKFPWRDYNSPYAVWISEIMLQQTQVSTVIPYFQNWMKKFPIIDSVAKADLDELHKAWEGLGYYRRVENIYKTSKLILNEYDSKMPSTYNELIKLHGIGDYTAAAILAIAYNKNYYAIDGNLKRILSRIFLIPKNKQVLSIYKKYCSKLIDKKEPSISIQACMDLGREICKFKNPKCNICPISNFCKAYKKNKMHLYPAKKNKKVKLKYDVVVALINKKNSFLISKRHVDKFLGNLWELPGGKIKIKETKHDALIREIKEELDIKIIINKYIGFVNHKYSHFEVNLFLYDCKFNGMPKSLQSQEIKWITKNEIKQFTFPKGTHKLFNLIFNNDV